MVVCTCLHRCHPFYSKLSKSEMFPWVLPVFLLSYVQRVLPIVYRIKITEKSAKAQHTAVEPLMMMIIIIIIITTTTTMVVIKGNR
jgi:heme/copper-type cytochrome/quinol oxidase subunit 4